MARTQESSSNETRPASAAAPSAARQRRPPLPAAAERGPGTPLLPVSAYPPLELPHPLQLFGREFKVRLSTRLTFSPDTLARAVLDTSLDAVLRKEMPQWHLLLRKLLYTAQRKHTPSSTTKQLLVTQLAPVIPVESLRRALAGEEVASAPSSDWATVLQGLKDGGGELNALATCLAACDAHLLEFVAPLARQDKGAANTHLEMLFAEEIATWRALNPHLLMQVCLLVEVALKALAFVEFQGPHPAAGPDPRASCFDVLLSPGLRPVGQWLKEVYTASDCKNLGQLAGRLEWRSKYHGRHISHDLLRKWSSSKKGVMPAPAMRPLLAAVRQKNWADTLPGRFYVARFFTFICDLLRASTIGEPPAWELVQAQVRSRYAQAYRLQVLHVPPARGSMPAAC